MMEREALHMEWKHQCYSSQWGEWTYSAQSWKEKRLLCESVFVLIIKWNLTLKINGKWSFSYETIVLMPFIPIRRMSYGAQSW